MTEKLNAKVKRCAMLLTTKLINLMQSCQYKLLGRCISFIARLIYFGLPLTCFHGLTLQEKITCIKIRMSIRKFILVLLC